MTDTTNRFPWRKHNNFELLVDGAQFYPVMLNHIRAARQRIYLEQYLIVSGNVLTDFIDALQQAAHRGVQVYLLLDEMGARGLNPADRERLQQAPLHCHFTNPFHWATLHNSLKRDHRKIIIIDDATAFVGGAGLADTFLHATGQEPAWHDVMVKIQGELIHDLSAVFAHNWAQQTGQLVIDAIPVLRPQGTQGAQVQLASGLRDNEIMRAAITQIKKSAVRIWIATPYFVTTRKLRRELRVAAKSGIDVRLLLPGIHSDLPWVSHAARKHYHGLLRDGVKIYEYQPSFIHAKVILCDYWVSIGSSNLDRWNQRWNLDANIAVAHDDFTATVVNLFEKDFAASIPISLQAWQARPWLQRWREWWHGQKLILIQWIEYWVIQLHRPK